MIALLILQFMKLITRCVYGNEVVSGGRIRLQYNESRYVAVSCCSSEPLSIDRQVDCVPCHGHGCMVACFVLLGWGTKD